MGRGLTPYEMSVAKPWDSDRVTLVAVYATSINRNPRVHQRRRSIAVTREA
jgi:hypothetical protein